MKLNNNNDLNLAQIAHEVRWALLITDAAIPLDQARSAVPTALGFAVETVPGPGEVPDETRYADLIALRAIAFRRVLHDLTSYDYVVSGEAAQALIGGRMPAEPEA